MRVITSNWRGAAAIESGKRRSESESENMASAAGVAANQLAAAGARAIAAASARKYLSMVVALWRWRSNHHICRNWRAAWRLRSVALL